MSRLSLSPRSPSRSRLRSPRSPVFDDFASSPGYSYRTTSASSTKDKLTNLQYEFPDHSNSELRQALREAEGHAGKARKILRELEYGGHGTHAHDGERGRGYASPSRRRSVSPRGRTAVAHDHRRATATGDLPARVCIQGLRHIGAKANGDYVCTVLSSEAGRLYLPSVIYEKEDGSGVSLFYDSGLWSIASSVGSDESMAYCESSSRDPTSIPRTRWQTSDGSTWVVAPARFKVYELDEYESDRYGYEREEVDSRTAIDQLQRDISELSLGLVPRRDMQARLDEMLESTRAIEEEHLALEDEVLELEQYSPVRVSKRASSSRYYDDEDEWHDGYTRDVGRHEYSPRRALVY